MAGIFERAAVMDSETATQTIVTVFLIVALVGAFVYWG